MGDDLDINAKLERLSQIRSDDGEAREIVLCHTRLAFPDPSASVPFPQTLRKLVLSHNAIAFLPDSLCHLVSLEHLDLSHNVLETFPETFGSLTSLRYLNLSHNLLSALPSGFNRLSQLVNLDLSFNSRLSAKSFETLLIPDFGRRCRKLRRVNLSWCNLCRVPPAFWDLLDLSQLILGSSEEDPSSHPSFENWLPSLPCSLLKLTRLTSLIAPNVGLSDLPDALETMTYLKHIDLSSNRIAWLPGTLHLT